MMTRACRRAARAGHFAARDDRLRRRLAEIASRQAPASAYLPSHGPAHAPPARLYATIASAASGYFPSSHHRMGEYYIDDAALGRRRFHHRRSRYLLAPPRRRRASAFCTPGLRCHDAAPRISRRALDRDWRYFIISRLMLEHSSAFAGAWPDDDAAFHEYRARRTAARAMRSSRQPVLSRHHMMIYRGGQPAPAARRCI